MSIDKKQLRELIRKTLRYLDPEIPYTEAAVELLMLTAAQETQLGTYLQQLAGGPARGIYQIEPASEMYVLTTLHQRHTSVYNKLLDLNAPADGQGSPDDCDATYNLAYATALARCYYWLKPGWIPKHPGDQAAYYKQNWNTTAGKATQAEALAAYCQLCLPI